MWSTLEIEPTVDISVIKKAYAKKLRIHHPEDDPEGYQTLREAYDRALKFARNNEFSEIDNEVLISDELRNSDIIKLIHLFEEEDFGDNNEENECIQQESEWVEGADNLLAGNEQLVEEFFQKAETLYNSFFDRIEKRNWEELLNSEIIWKLDLKEFMNKRMLEFLTGHHYLPQEVWYLLNEIFHWEYQEDYLKYNCKRVFTKYLLNQISNDIAPRYCYFKRNMGIDFEEYLNYRETAFAALLPCCP
jgi:hypothetical protein